ncbi:protein boule-like [Echeneis naucrates]|uniref:protein boule-like n=1 Tax=Echeneis naucrates TaxID=173247 RepID=UPI0011146CA6|nr:protein boule-like [Echeneis naucrates]
MEEEKQNALTSTCSSSTSDVSPAENLADSPFHHTSRPGTVIPNRIFVGGIDYKVNESDLQHFFSQHGAVKEVKIVIDHTGMSKGYGFVTFETQEDALKILNNGNGISFKDKKLSIGQAVRKRQVSRLIKSVHMACPDPILPLPMSCGTLYLTASTGCPYAYDNEAAYFHCPNVNPPPHPWPPPVMLPQSQPVYQPPAYHHNQSPMPASPVVLSQPTEHLYQPLDGGCVPPPLHVMEGSTPDVYLQGKCVNLPPQSLLFPNPRVHLKPKYRHHIHHKDYQYLPEAIEPPDAAVFHAAQTHM